MAVKRSFADGTVVPVTKTREEISKILKDAGVSQLHVGEDMESCEVRIGFVLEKIQIQMRIKLPPPNFGRYQGDGEREERRRWRCLFLSIKSKLVAVADGISTLEQEWLPFMITATGETVFERVRPAIEHAKQTGMLNAMLALPPGRENEQDGAGSLTGVSDGER